MISRARQHRASGDVAASLALFQAASKLQPGHTGLRLEAAADLLKLGRPDEAQAEYQQGLPVGPSPSWPVDRAGPLRAASQRQGCGARPFPGRLRLRSDAHLGAYGSGGRALRGRPF